MFSMFRKLQKYYLFFTFLQSFFFVVFENIGSLFSKILNLFFQLPNFLFIRFRKYPNYLTCSIISKMFDNFHFYPVRFIQDFQIYANLRQVMFVGIVFYVGILDNCSHTNPFICVFGQDLAKFCNISLRKYCRRINRDQDVLTLIRTLKIGHTHTRSYYQFVGCCGFQADFQIHASNAKVLF